LWKSAGWARLAGAGRAIGFAPRWRREPLSSVLLTEQALLGPEAVHVIDKNLALLRTVGISARASGVPAAATEAMAARVDAGLKETAAGQDYVVLNPGGGWTSKLWPAQSFGRVAIGLRERGLASLVSWGPGEEKLADRVVAASEGAARRAFPTTLLEYVELARRARLVVAADTGPSISPARRERRWWGSSGPDPRATVPGRRRTSPFAAARSALPVIAAAAPFTRA
jgi:ADP-heptose:LPS heptosyltransferase